MGRRVSSALGPQAFSIFGLFDQAPMEFVTTVPFGIGDMSFPPAPMLPWLQPYLFTAASTLGPINGVPALTPATSSPWTAPPFAIPFPLDLSFQAVIEESPGVFAVTNLVVLRVR